MKDLQMNLIHSMLKKKTSLKSFLRLKRIYMEGDCSNKTAVLLKQVFLTMKLENNMSKY